MGCICSKGVRTNDDYIETNHVSIGKENPKASKKQSDSEETSVNGNEATLRLIPDDVKDTFSDEEVEELEEKKESSFEMKSCESVLQKGNVLEIVDNVGPLQPRMSRIGSVSNGDRAAKVIAGWPSWLVSVAGEAINGWIPRSADSFEKLEMIGQGTYSSVYRARDLETNQIVALKKVRFANMDPESVRFMAREIIILRRLNHPNVMKLEGLIISKASGSMYLIFEYMDHDLAGLASTPGIKFSQAQIKCYMKQLLLGLEHCHSCGVLHRDIKCSNLLLDRNNNLKIGDFGLSNFYRGQRKQPLTSRVVTLWYRPPELLLGSTDYGVTVDLWSTGCILAELFTGKPLLPGRTEVEQMHKIFKLCGSPSEEYWRRSRLRHATIFKPQHPYKRCVADTFKDLPSSALALLEVLLAVEPDARGTASSALQSEFFTTKPFPSEPSSLPRYQPRKEFDAKLREEEARRRKGSSSKQNEQKRLARESKAVPAPSANAELLASIQKRLGETNRTSISEKFNPEGDSGNGFRIEPLKGNTAQNPYPIYTNGDNHPNGSSQLRTQRSYVQRGSGQLSRFSNSMAPTRDGSQFGSMRDAIVNQRWLEDGSENFNLSQRLLEKPNGIRKDDPSSSSKESIMGYDGEKRGRIQYSGPLIPGEGNLDEMLKEHERQILLAVRRAQADKAKRDDNRQAQTLFPANGR
ncbi:Protein kinase superfamily protein [Arabidopsis thaliana]|jgi:serine/threonine protein kinase|uniref:Protein kinase superfamily protein n=1 Tax=Arabidopsis thaliana TaxID=3702 RepID=F4I854_ARATH|nr:Protein kinase superfamily protein [Arabidopsis thaliana]AEE33454.1 Protein kinase superfamily protein [Arabidopsis thaliana]|eukprot:NP_176083.2 Protein kinase superfamily protein [Arabidopsis thaliana]